ncbi:hypothetical protein GQF61_16275 [Sphingobacterium sp. DK4209]|uniref:Uncharacterized protein n=1 Tax=Sphingobacterium zhuxiongii TaxID=2662364 RepID=A0A5Q0Q810_9SPHI|nr:MULTISPECIES: hypothetical protein [unclassified Sphingobacterium]MVZ67412.1 hypothetical protein [Sphingobacterium sp. DK4209]QGA25394.1 hypothetical protein GFH32_03235 [Sphingobacterium sp. dk4302]
MERLTIKEALEQGYTHFAYGHPSNGFQSLHELSELTDDDIKDSELYLAGKHTFRPCGLTNEELKELIAEHIWVNHEDNTGDDTDTIYDAIKEIDFQDVSERIEKVLDQYNSFRYVTEIRLALPIEGKEVEG